MLQVARGRGRIGRIHPSVNPFIPKPGTPYQWLPMEDPKETDRKLQYLRKAFGRMPNVDAICKSARTGAVQSVLAVARPQGGRRARARGHAGARPQARAARERARPVVLPLPPPPEGRDPAVGPDRQRRQQGLLLARAREEREGAASRRTAPSSRAASAAACASRRRTRPTRCPRSGRAARRCRSTRSWAPAAPDTEGAMADAEGPGRRPSIVSRRPCPASASDRFVRECAPIESSRATCRSEWSAHPARRPRRYSGRLRQ